MRAILSILICLTLPSAGAATYEWTDEHGGKVYSDRPLVPGAKNIQIKPTEPAKLAPPAPTEVSKEASPSIEGAVRKFNELRITSPANDETIHDNTGSVSVTFALDPPPGAGAKLKIRMYLDGSAMPETLTTLQFTLRDVARGTHTLRAELLDDAGNTQLAAQEVTFNLWQASQLFPNRRIPQVAP